MELLRATGSRAARTAAPLAMALCVLAGCAGGDGAGPENEGPVRIGATVDGKAWSSNAVGGQERAALSAPGLYVLQGAQLEGSTQTSIVITLYNIRGPGTYPLGVNGMTVGGSALYVESARGWSTPLSGDAGTITITELTATKLVGTFSFTAEGISGGATGTRSITGGRFDLPVQTLGTVGPLPDNAGGRVSATIAGRAWNAATIAGALFTSGSLIFSTSNTSYAMGFSLAGAATPGTYPLTSTRVIVVSTTATPPSTWGTAAGSTGTVTLATVTATRVTGTFSATLAPSPGTTGTLTITNGTFDLGR